MVTKTANILLYDNFKIGIAEVKEEPGTDHFIHITFTEQDFEDESRNLAHIFKIHEKQLDDYINMLQEAKGSRVHLPTKGERRAVGH